MLCLFLIFSSSSFFPVFFFPFFFFFFFFLSLSKVNHGEQQAEGWRMLEDDVLGQCWANMTVATRAEHVAVSKTKSFKDCVVSASRTNAPDGQSETPLGHMTSGQSFIDFYLHGETGHLERVRFREHHSSAVTGKRSEQTTVSNEGSLNLVSVRQAPRSRRDVPMAHEEDLVAAIAAELGLQDEDGHGFEPVALHSDLDTPPGISLVERRRRGTAAPDNNEGLSEEQLAAAHDALMANVRLVAAAPRSNTRAHIQAMHQVTHRSREDFSEPPPLFFRGGTTNKQTNKQTNKGSRKQKMVRPSYRALGKKK
jgi:hypothetical protein